MFVTDVVLCVCKILFKSGQICGCCCKMLRGSLFWDTRYKRHNTLCSPVAPKGRYNNQLRRCRLTFLGYSSSSHGVLQVSLCTTAALLQTSLFTVDKCQEVGAILRTDTSRTYSLSKDHLNPFYFQSHSLTFHSQLQHVIPLPCINLCNAPL